MTSNDIILPTIALKLEPDTVGEPGADRDLEKLAIEAEVRADDAKAAVENLLTGLKATMEDVSKSLQKLDTRLKDIEKWRKS
jgi:hypothetical protein